MRNTLLVSGALALIGTALPAQTVRWNDRPTATWAEEAPRVRVYIDGSASVAIGTPVRVRFEVDDNAYVTVVRVDDNGRMTILYPYSRTQRASVRGNMVHYVRSPRLGREAAFLATDRLGGGYVFAIASYAPLDFSSFENRDYDRFGGYSAFTLANRSIARRPDVFIDRFAAAVLWDRDTPYDYDVAYYFTGGPSIMNAYALCSAMYGQFGSQWYRTALMYDWDNFGYSGYPYSSMCRGYYQRAYCFSFLALYSSAWCNFGTHVVVGQPTTPVGGQPTDSAAMPNEGVVRGGLFTPTPVPVPVDPPPQEGRVDRFDQATADALDDFKSIPVRATKKMKEDDARRAREAAGGAPARTDFSAAAGKPDKVTTTASADAPSRVQPPPREPTRAKGTTEPRRDKRGFGSTVGRTSEPRDVGRDRVSRPVDTRTTGTSAGGSTANPPSIKSAPTGEKKKPPM